MQFSRFLRILTSSRFKVRIPVERAPYTIRLLVSSRTSVPRQFAILANILAAAIVILGIVATATTIWLVVHTYSPVLFGDQWELIRTLVKSHGHPSLRDFWAQHNEHRIVTGRLFGFADFYFFG